MQELFVAFLSNPTPESFRALRDVVVTSPNYDGYSQDLRDMERALDEKRFTDVKNVFAQAQPNLLLSPSAHLLLSQALKEEGNEKASDLERFICFRCVDGITNTGDGTRARPYLVLRTSDEYDVLNAQGKRFASQHLVHEGSKSYDRMVCADDSEVWFDITDMMAAMARRLNG
jgi:hypothetical protein